MTDKERDYRIYAVHNLLDAIRRATGSSSVWSIRHAIEQADDWLARAEKMETERERLEAVERECAEFNAAMAECAR